jgi:hypothetical protein
MRCVAKIDFGFPLAASFGAGFGAVADIRQTAMTPEPGAEKPSPNRAMKQLRRAHDQKARGFKEPTREGAERGKEMTRPAILFAVLLLATPAVAGDDCCDERTGSESNFTHNGRYIPSARHRDGSWCVNEWGEQGY